MNRDELLKRLTGAVDAALAGRLYGKIEIEFRAGHPTFLRVLNEEKLDNRETPTNGRTTRY